MDPSALLLGDEGEPACDSCVRHSPVWCLPLQPATHTVRDPKRIAAVLASLCQARATGQIRVASTVPPLVDVGAKPFAVVAAPGPSLLLAAQVPGAIWHATWEVELQGPFALVQFRLPATERHDDGSFTPPSSLEFLYQRAERRVPAPSSTRISIRRTGCAEGLTSHDVLDLGFHGLRFVASQDDHLDVGQLIEADVTWKHGPTIPLSLLIRHVGAVDTQGRCWCGAEIVTGASPPLEMWQVQISSLLHPDTTLATAAHAEQLWDLYDVSGYFSIDGRSVSDFARLKEAFYFVSAKLERAHEVGYSVVQHYRGQVEGAVSLLRQWSGAWLIYQGARRQEGSPLGLSGNQVLRNLLFHAYELAQQDVRTRWHVAYVRKDARFTRLSNCDFVASQLDPDLAAIVPFRAFEITVTTSAVYENSAEVDVGFASVNELSSVLEALERRFPRPYLEAYDFVPERFLLDELRSTWSKARLTRDRTVVVARRRGKVVAAGVLDASEPGIHLVGLTDCVHLIALGPDGHAHLGRVLGAAQRYYACRGAERFVLFEETGEYSYLSAFPSRDMGDVDQVFFSAQLTREYLEHLIAITAPRLEGKARIP